MYEVSFLADGDDGKLYRIVATYREKEPGSGVYLDPEYRIDFMYGQLLDYDEKGESYTLKNGNLRLKKKKISK